MNYQLFLTLSFLPFVLSDIIREPDEWLYDNYVPQNINERWELIASKIIYLMMSGSGLAYLIRKKYEEETTSEEEEIEINSSGEEELIPYI